MRPSPPNSARGWTLVELIVVIAVTGIVAATVMTFLRTPVAAYADTVRRAELADAADTALRRITRDLRMALPNSVRIKTVGSAIHLEYLQVVSGTRYREYPDAAGAGDPLDFTAADGAFDVIGPMPSFATGDSIVIFNVNAEETGTGSNAYAGDNRARYVGVTGTTLTVEDPGAPPGTPKLFPFPSPGRRFHVVRYPVTYVCDAAPGVRQLRRYWNYAIQATQPLTFAPGTSEALLAHEVTACVFAYDVNPAMQRVGVVSLTLELTRGGESVRLFQQVHLNNVP